MADPFVAVSVSDDHVATVTLCRPPNNFFSSAMIAELADAFETLDEDRSCRAIVLAADGKHFCAGADFSSAGPADSTGDLYRAAVRLFRTRKPFIAAVQGAAIGGGLGVVMAADFRVAAPEARFSANFARLGFHHGFGLSVTLPAAVGGQHAADLLYTGRRITGDEAAVIGLVDRVVPLHQLESTANDLAAEIAGSAPLAVQSIRATLRGDLADRVAAATDHERAEQERLRRTVDFREGTRAMSERRPPQFTGVE
ncbi:MAG TPA: enoyl-CoA hydratase/isomerase family protein [Ilumatobacteraceae bacterium]|nr:enoyl-CoA hydratase/isomerase family protein [Ilumatobacteraceae bacterium]